MAEATIIDSRLRLTFETGLNDKGEPMYKQKTYSNIQKTATADQLSQAAQAIGGLSANPLQVVERVDYSEIIE